MKGAIPSPGVQFPIDPIQEDRLLTTAEVAGLLGLSAGTIKDWRGPSRRFGPNFIRFRVGSRVRYSLQDLRKWVMERTVRTENPRRAVPFYGRTRIEELAAKHPGLSKFVEEHLRRRVRYREIAAAILNRWHERVSDHVLHSYYVLRVWPKICDEERSQGDAGRGK